MHDAVKTLGLSEINDGAHDGVGFLPCRGAILESRSPATGELLARVRQADAETYEKIVQGAESAFKKWREVPAPKRGEVIRQIGEVLRQKKAELGRLVSLEMGKIASEGLGEVQEMIDICDFAVGLSRQLYGSTMHSERPVHRMYEQWHPMGIVAIITAFNFPVAVWSWNSALAAVCGNSMIWKPSPKTPLCALATQRLLEPIVKAHGLAGLFSLVLGPDAEIGERLVADPRVPIVSATGSSRMGKRVGQVVASRFGRSILELGGNNAIIALPDCDQDLLLRAVLFGAVGTAGQRCTTTRRLFLHETIADAVLARLLKAYGSVRIGDPLDPTTLMGPLIDDLAVQQMMHALEQVKQEGGEVLVGGKKLDRPGHFVEPTVVSAHPGMKIWREETFAPILYVFRYSKFEEALELHNSVEQGLSSSIFTRDLITAERFLAASGSDCGIANVNIGTSGAEIGGAFGGEKSTGGGREAGSDSWKQYMRRQTNTINWSKDLPLAQGVKFDI
jgi:aldehyde dehydrogenase (NAD+)